jgi:hypothetical protein
MASAFPLIVSENGIHERHVGMAELLLAVKSKHMELL